MFHELLCHQVVGSRFARIAACCGLLLISSVCLKAQFNQIGSPLDIKIKRSAEDGHLNLTWESQEEVIFTIYNRESLDEGDWTKTATLPSSAPSTQSFAVSLHKQSQTMFYLITGKAVFDDFLSMDLGGGISMEFVKIPAGIFVMGSPENEVNRGWDEGPVTNVTISKSFLLGKHEVTQAQWTRLKGRHQNRWTGDNLPVERINRRDALSFCEQLTELAHFEKGLPQRFFFTLPTEAQWEYACRAGTDTMFYYGTDEDYSQLSEYAWYARNSNSRTHPVGYKLPNKWGLYDMYGNVWEWCRDWYSDSYAGGSIIDPLGPKNGTDRVVRGGSWSNIETLFRSALRSWDSPDISSDEIGFRVVMISEPD